MKIKKISKRVCKETSINYNILLKGFETIINDYNINEDDIGIQASHSFRLVNCFDTIVIREYSKKENKNDFKDENVIYLKNMGNWAVDFIDYPNTISNNTLIHIFKYDSDTRISIPDNDKINLQFKFKYEDFGDIKEMNVYLNELFGKFIIMKDNGEIFQFKIYNDLELVRSNS